MVDGVLNVIPNAKIGHIGLYRDEETFEPVEYYYKMPEGIGNREVLVVDPMLATGSTATSAIAKIKEHGVKNIKFMCIIASPEGLDKLMTAHPDIDVYCGCKDKGLNENKYIIPGLGDAGDRLFGTL